MKLKIGMKLIMTLTLGQDEVRLGEDKESTTRTQKEETQLST
jgi:hypothetical protein